MKRFPCLKLLLSRLDPKTVTVASFRGTSEEWAYLRGNKLNFYGLNMGLCTPVAVGVAAARRDLKVVALDSDGSFLLDTGVLITAAKLKLNNLLIIVFDNEVYGPFGPTATSDTVDLSDLAKASGITNARTIRSIDEFEDAIPSALQFAEPTFLCVKVEHFTEPVNGPYRQRNGIIIREDFAESLRELT